mmetsp:Transcript_18269/g.52758  ORF Transcript_18269/g.52758 Transcript_18269/m.52758 type:complete len:294 (-) Transcript_18269:26-907(-)
MSSLKGKVCVVTGGGGGIGRALAEAAARSGASAVCVADVDLDAARAVASSLPSLAPSPSSSTPCRTLAIRADCGREMDVRRVINSAWTRFGTVDAYFSNAGVLANGGAECPDDEWDRIWRINVMAHVWAARHLLPRWGEAAESSRGGGGRRTFVVTASAAGLLAQIGSLPYTVTKRAAVSVAEWMSISHGGSAGGGEGIRVHCLCPQAVRTDMIPKGTDGMFAGLDGIFTPEQVAQETIKAVDEGRFLVLPHKQVAKYMQNKAKDVDRWIAGMRKVHEKYGEMTRYSPTTSKL